MERNKRKTKEQLISELEELRQQNANLKVLEIRRKQAEETLKDSEIRYRRLFEAAKDGILILDADTELILDVNPFLAGLLGFSQQDFLGKELWELGFLRDVFANKENFEELKQKGYVRYEDIPLRTYDGRQLNVEFVSNVYDVDHRKIIQCNIRDITERKQVEKALKESEARYRNVVELAKDGICIIQNMQVKYCNPQLAEMWGGTVEDIIDTPFPNYVHPDALPTVVELYKHRMASEQTPSRYETALRTKDGRKVYVELNVGRIEYLGQDAEIAIVHDITERKQAEETLRQEKDMAQTYLDIAGVIIVAIDAEGKITLINRRGCQVLGFEVQEIIGKNWFTNFLPERVREKVVNVWRRIIAGELEPLRQYENQVLTRGGEERIITWNNVELRDETGEIIGTLSSGEDITERKQMEEALKNRGEFLNNIIENTPNPIWVSDEKGTIIRMNQALRDLLKITDEEIIGKYNVLEDTQVIEQGYLPLIKSVFEKGKTINFTLNYDTAKMDQLTSAETTSKVLEIVISTVKDKEGRVIHAICQEKDITKQKQMEESLRDSEAKFRDLYENAPVAYFSVGTDGLIKESNRAAQLLFGYSEEDLIGKPRIELYAPEGVAKAVTVFEKFKSGTTFENEEMIYQRKDGDKVYGLLSITPILDEKGQVVTTRSVIKDITDRKKAEEERRKFENKAQIVSRLAAVGEMAAGIAHEINNPLTGVLGFSKLMLEKENVPEDLKDDIKLIVDGSQRVADIVKRLLIFARQTKPVRTAVNLNELIDNTIKLRDYVLKTANIEVITRFDPELPWSVVDPGQLQQVFLNIIVNAEQAMKEVHVSGTLTITTEKKGNNILISFQDDGDGIANENMRRLFEPFFTTKEPGEGVGLGLSLSRSIVLEHGGEMKAESEPGKGATFIIELPITEALPPEADASSPVAKVKPTSTKKGRILVVDDEPGVRNLLEKTLTRIGHSVDTTANARDAVAKLDASTAYDIIITDVRMPGMSGIELYKRILEKMPAMVNRTIFITGDIMGADIKAFLINNNLSYLSKPFDIEALKEKVDAILGDVPPDNNSPDGGSK